MGLVGEVTSRHPWKHSFQTLGFAFIIIGAILTMIGFVALNTLTYCPAGGCVYNLPESLILAAYFLQDWHLLSQE